MTSSTFSFKLYLAALYAVIVGWIGLAICFSSFKAVDLMVRRSSPYAFRAAIDRIHPDLILVGNSYLWASIDQPSLERQLSTALARPIKVAIFADGGVPISWMYLALKNQIANSTAREIPVGVFSLGSEMVSFNRNLSRRQLWLIHKLLDNDEPVFYRKTGIKPADLRLLGKIMDTKFELAEFLTVMWSRLLLFSIGGTDPFPILNSHFHARQMPPSERLQLSPAREPDQQNGCAALLRCADQTFLPDIIDAMKFNRLFFVEVHPRPGFETQVRAPTSLKPYLKSHNTGWISLADKTELNDERLYADGHHLASSGTIISTRLFAEEVLRLLR